MAFLFTNSDWLGFNNLSNSQKEVFSAERVTEIHSVLITNKTNNDIRVYLEVVKPLANPIQRTLIARSYRVLKSGSQDLLVVKNNVDDVTTNDVPPTSRRISDGDNLICYSDGATQLFDCTVFFTELNETEELV